MKINGALAQSVELETENLRVPRSNRGGTTKLYASVPERLKGDDCKSSIVRLRWFESTPVQFI